MSSTFLGIEIAKRALAAHQQALNVTGHNISNANTEGYSRQRVRFVTTPPDYPPLPQSPTIAGQIGTGVIVASIERVRDLYLDTRIAQEKEVLGYWEALYPRLHQVELVYNEPSGKGIRDLLNEFWKSLQELANNPDQPKIRALVIERGRMLSEGIRNTYSHLSDIRDEINGEIVNKVTQINEIGGKIASLNGRISKVLAEGKNPNDLLDERELLIENLSKLVDITVERSKPNELKISIGGRVFIQGDHLYEIETVRDQENDGMAKIQWKGSKERVDIKNGELRALLDVRDDTIKDYHFARLDEYAIYLIDRFNEIHRAGFGLNGSRGVNFFEPFKTLEKEERIFKIVGSKAGYVHDPGMSLHDPFDPKCITLSANPSMEGLHPEGAFEINGHIFHYIASKDSLQDIVKRINDAGIGVMAHISPEHRLVLTATSSAKTPYTIISMSDDPQRTEFQSTSSRNEVALNTLDKTRDFRTAGFDPKFNLNTRIRVKTGAVEWISLPFGSYFEVNDFITDFNNNVPNVRLFYDSNTDRFTITNNSGGVITIQDIEATTYDVVTDGFVARGAKLSADANTTSLVIRDGVAVVSREMVVTNSIDFFKTMSALDTTCAFATAGFNTVPTTSLDLSRPFAQAGFLKGANLDPYSWIRITDGINTWSSDPLSSYASLQEFIDHVNRNAALNGIELTLSYNPEADKFIFEATGSDNVQVSQIGVGVGNIGFLELTNFGAGTLSINSGTFKISQAGVGPGARIRDAATNVVLWEHALSDFSSIDEFIDSIKEANIDVTISYDLYADKFAITNNSANDITIEEIIPMGGTGLWTGVKIPAGVINSGSSRTSISEVVSNTDPSKTPVSFRRAGFFAHPGSSIITIRTETTPGSNQYTEHRFYIDPDRTSVREFMSAVNSSSCGVNITYDPILDKFTIKANTRGTDFAIHETLGIKSKKEVSDGGTINLTGDWTTGSGWDTDIAPQIIRINGVEFRIGAGGYTNLQSLIDAVNNSMAGVMMSYSKAEPDRLTLTSNNGERILIEGGLGPGVPGDFWDEVGIDRGIHGGFLSVALIPSGKIAGNLLYKLGILKEEKAYTWSKRDSSLGNIFAGTYTRVPMDGAASRIRVSQEIEDDPNKIATSKGIDTSSPLDGVWDLPNGVFDGSNALELASLKEKLLFNNGTATFGDFLSETISRVATRASTSKEEKENQELFLQNLYNLRNSISGVSLDEEMINMIKFQQGYQAAARITAVMNELIQLIIELV